MTDPRIEQILAMIIEMSGDNMKVSVTPTSETDEVDAILVGLKVLAEEKAHSMVLMEECERVNQGLQTSLEKIKWLTGLLPICMYCKKIQDSDGLWIRIEQYLDEHTDAKFTHGLCGECLDVHHAK